MGHKLQASINLVYLNNLGLRGPQLQCNYFSFFVTSIPGICLALMLLQFVVKVKRTDKNRPIIGGTESVKANHCSKGQNFEETSSWTQIRLCSNSQFVSFLQYDKSHKSTIVSSGKQSSLFSKTFQSVHKYRIIIIHP